ncbi:MAG: sigma-70 family polymerase sigma factor [Flaviaesturariibacter sp.]|nr:sigma-70 family polymerase sigma factor [Flaviaesturariibacter sp.]
MGFRMQICALCILVLLTKAFVKNNRYAHITDTELLERYKADGNSEWLGHLLERYTLLLLGVCMKYLKDETEARDAVQQIFLKVLTEVSKYQIDYFKSWIYMVAKNHCLMKLRSGKKTQDIEGQRIAAPEDGKEELLQDERTYNLLEESIEELTPEQKTCVTLFYLQKKSYQQISAQTGYDGMKVKSYIQNGKRNLRMLLEKKLKPKK